ncbi:MAG: hypothetical protein ACREL7_09895 [Longimicrobiales bacterium]
MPLYRGAALLFLNTTLVLLLFELLAAITLRLLPPRPDVATRARQAYHARIEALSYYAVQPWAQAFWEEHWAVERRQHYHPFTVWRIAPFEGRYVHIGDSGLRRVPGADCGPGTFRVFVFGGSAAWGWGAPDSATIPALLQQRMSARSQRACIVNFAQNAFVSTQEVIALLQALQAGDVPGLALFYDGYNDIHAARDFHRAGTHMMLTRIRDRFQQTDGTVGPGPLRTLVSATNTFALLRRLVARPRRLPGLGEQSPDTADTTLTQRLADDVVRTYLTNVSVARALGVRFGFHVVFVWQPLLPFVEKPLSSEETRMLDNLGDMSLARAVDERIRAVSTRANLLDLRDVFAGDSASRWIDFVHLNPDGNRIVAARIDIHIGSLRESAR